MYKDNKMIIERNNKNHFGGESEDMLNRSLQIWEDIIDKKTNELLLDDDSLLGHFMDLGDELDLIDELDLDFFGKVKIVEVEEDLPPNVPHVPRHLRDGTT